MPCDYTGGKILVYDFWTLWTLRPFWILNSLNFELFEFELFEFWTLWILNSLNLNSLSFELFAHDKRFELLKFWTLYNVTLYLHFHEMISELIVSDNLQPNWNVFLLQIVHVRRDGAIYKWLSMVAILYGVDGIQYNDSCFEWRVQFACLSKWCPRPFR